MQMRSMLGRVRGLGSAKEGLHHWWGQRLTAVILIPLILYFVFKIVSLAGADHAAVAAWLSKPSTGGVMILLLAALYHHAHLGLQVVIEDYVHHEPVKLLSLIVMKAVVAFLAIVSILSVAKLVFRG